LERVALREIDDFLCETPAKRPPTLTSVGKWMPVQTRDWTASSASVFNVCASRGNRYASARAAALETQPWAAGWLGWFGVGKTVANVGLKDLRV